MIEVSIVGEKEVRLTDVPWWIVLLERITTGGFLHKIPLPSWPRVCRFEGEWYSLKEYWGDVGCWWMSMGINRWVFQWIYNRIDGCPRVSIVSPELSEDIRTILWGATPDNDKTEALSGEEASKREERA